MTISYCLFSVLLVVVLLLLLCVAAGLGVVVVDDVVWGCCCFLVLLLFCYSSGLRAFSAVPVKTVLAEDGPPIVGDIRPANMPLFQ